MRMVPTATVALKKQKSLCTLGPREFCLTAAYFPPDTKGKLKGGFFSEQQFELLVFKGFVGYFVHFIGGTCPFR